MSKKQNFLDNLMGIIRDLDGKVIEPPKNAGIPLNELLYPKINIQLIDRVNKQITQYKAQKAYGNIKKTSSTEKK